VVKSSTFDQVAPPMMSTQTSTPPRAATASSIAPTDLRGVGHIGDNRDGITSPADDLADDAMRALLVDIDTSHRGARLSKGQRREPSMARALRDVAAPDTTARLPDSPKLITPDLHCALTSQPSHR